MTNIPIFSHVQPTAGVQSPFLPIKVSQIKASGPLSHQRR